MTSNRSDTAPSAPARRPSIEKIAIAAFGAAAVLATGCATDGEPPDTPATPTSHVPGTTATAPTPTDEASTPSPEQETTRESGRSLPAECKHPAGESVRQSCIEEYGPEGVGTVEPVQPPPDETGSAPVPEESAEVSTPDETEASPEVPSTEEQIEQCTEQTGEPEACREKIDP